MPWGPNFDGVGESAGPGEGVDGGGADVSVCRDILFSMLMMGYSATKELAGDSPYIKAEMERIEAIEGKIEKKAELLNRRVGLHL